MKIITVSGAHSNIGKTTVIERLLKIFKGWSCLKVTVTRKGRCPRKTACGVCSEQDKPFSIISDPGIINQKGKDTQRMKSAGAKKVLWLKATPPGLGDGLKRALKKLETARVRGIVIEGTSILKYLKPDLGIFIDAKGRIKYLRCL